MIKKALILMTGILLFFSCTKEEDDVRSGINYVIYDSIAEMAPDYIQFLNESVGYAIYKDDFIKTLDGGEMWNSASFQVENFGYFPPKPFHFHNEEIGLLLHENKLNTTNDGANTWNEVYQFDSMLVSEAVWLSDNIMLLAGIIKLENDEYEVQIHRTPDAGSNWNVVYKADLGKLQDQGGGKYSLIHGLDVDFTSSEIAFVSAGGNLYKTRNSGMSWNQIITEHFTLFFDFYDEDNGMSMTYDKGYKTNDGGNSWQRISLGSQDLNFGWDDHTSKGIQYGNERTVYLWGLWSGLMKSHDWGSTFQPLDLGNRLTFDVQMLDENTGFYSSQFEIKDGESNIVAESFIKTNIGWD